MAAILPAFSHRRRVATLTFSTFAASPIGTSSSVFMCATLRTSVQHVKPLLQRITADAIFFFTSDDAWA